nr:MAG TPA: hypothetical protein [Bacteriophage sp.]
MWRSTFALFLMRVSVALVLSSLIGLSVRLWVKSGSLGLLEPFLDVM